MNGAPGSCRAPGPARNQACPKVQLLARALGRMVCEADSPTACASLAACPARLDPDRNEKKFMVAKRVRSRTTERRAEAFQQGTPEIQPRPDFRFPGENGRTYLDSDLAT